MRIQISDKQLGARWVVIWSFEKEWDWTDFIEAVDKTLEKIEINTDIEDVILDIRFEIPDEHLAIPNLRQMLKKLANCSFVFVMEGSSLMTSIITNVLRDNFSECENILHFVHSLDDAFNFIQSNDETPSSKTTAPQTDQTCHCSDNR